MVMEKFNLRPVDKTKLATVSTTLLGPTGGNPEAEKGAGWKTSMVSRVPMTSMMLLESTMS